MRENTDQNNSEYEHFLRSVWDYSYSMRGIFLEKLLFSTSWYGHVGVRIRMVRNVNFSKKKYEGSLCKCWWDKTAAGIEEQTNVYQYRQVWHLARFATICTIKKTWKIPMGKKTHNTSPWVFYGTWSRKASHMTRWQCCCDIFKWPVPREMTKRKSHKLHLFKVKAAPFYPSYSMIGKPHTKDLHE